MMIKLALILCFYLLNRQPVASQATNVTDCSSLGTELGSGLSEFVAIFINYVRQFLVTVISWSEDALTRLSELTLSLESVGRKVQTKITQLSNQAMNCSRVYRLRIEGQVSRYRQLDGNIKQQIRVIQERIASLNRTSSASRWFDNLL